MEFFSSIKNSIYNPDYYRNLITKRFSYSLKYFLALLLFISFLYNLSFSLNFIPDFKLIIDEIRSGILQRYPNDLEVSIKKGKVSTNAKEPYFVSMPADNGIKNQFPYLKNILVIDTKNDFSLEQFKLYSTHCLVNQQNLACYGQNGQVRITNLSAMPDFNLNKSVITNFINKISPFINIVYPILIVFSFILIFLGFLIGQSIYLILAALLIWLLAKMKGVGIGYKKSYQLGLHLLTFPLIIRLLIFIVENNFLGKTVYVFFGFYTALLLMIAFLNLKNTGNTRDSVSVSTN